MFANVAYAAGTLPIISNLNRLIVNPLITLLIAVAVATFIWGVVETIEGEGTKRDQGKQHMLWGVVGLFIMVSAIGILNVVCRTIGCN